MNALLLHGFSRGGEMWGPLFDGLAPHLPGHRGTAAPIGDFSHAVDALAQLIDGSSPVLGYSMGARLALALAIRYPAKVRWLVLDGGSLGLSDERERATRRADDAKWAELLRTQGIEAFCAAWEAQPIFGGAAPVPERRAHQPQDLARALEVFGKGAMPYLGDDAAGVRCPVLLLNGEQDTRGNAEADRLAQRLPHARRATLPGHHAAHLQSPAAWRERVHTFARGLSREVTA